MTELSYALASGQQYAGLTPVEQAAAEKDLHLSTCDEPYLEDCGVCQVKLSRIRRVIEAVRPVIEEEVRASVLREEGDDMRRQAQRLAESGVAPYLVDGLAYAGDGLAALAYEAEVRASVENTVGRHAVHEEQVDG